MPSAARRDRREAPRVHPAVDTLGRYSWRLIGIGIVAWALVHGIGALRLVVFPIVVATFLTVVLSVPARWLRSHGWRPLAAAWAVFLGFLLVVAAALALIVPRLADGFADLGPTLEEAVDDIETWLVEDSPFDLTPERVAELEEQLVDRARETLSNSSGVLLDTAVLALEVVAGILLSLVMTFFFVKDGHRFTAWAITKVPEDRRDVARRAAIRGRRTVAGYLKGSAALGALEGIVIGLTLALAGGSLVAPVMALTFVAAFVPLVGAVVAGVVAVLVALATAGTGAAFVVAIVALLVQQFDNDLLAPLVFGKALDLHPLIILVAVTAGGSLAGLAGAFVAVPLTALVVNVTAEIRNGDAAEADAT